MTGMHRDLVRQFCAPAYEEFVRSSLEPEAFQSALWREVTAEIQDSAFWRSRIRSIPGSRLEDYAITEFADYRPWLDLARGGRISPLNGKPIIWWGRTTGTTNTNRKLIPYTQSHFLSCQKFMSTSVWIELERMQTFTKGSFLGFVGFDPESEPQTQLPVGLLSAFMNAFLGPEQRRQSALPPPVYGDLDTFRKLAPVCALASDVVLFRAVTAAPLVSFLDELCQNIDEFWPYLRGDRALPAGLPALRMKAARYEHLRSVFAERAQPTLKALWPSAQAVRCWKSSSAGLLLAGLTKYLSPEVRVLHGSYGSTEGMMALPAVTDADGGPVCASIAVLEFLEVGAKLDKANLLPLWALKEGQRYEIFITNTLGFVRYRTHDVVTCIGYFNRVPVIQFHARADASIALGHAHFLQRDLVDALEKSGRSIGGRWVFAPRGDGRGLTLLHDGSCAHVAELASAVEHHLREDHSTYRAVRAAGQLDAIELRCVPAAHPYWNRFPTAFDAQAKPLVVAAEPFREQSP